MEPLRHPGEGRLVVGSSTRRFKACDVALLVPILAAAVLLGTTGAIAAPQALSFTVNTTADTNDANLGNSLCADSGGMCSLRAAIQELNARWTAGDHSSQTVTLPAGTYTLSLGEIPINANVSVSGAGSSTTIVQAATAPNTATNRVFNTNTSSIGVDVALSGLWIRHGKRTGSSSQGGGVRGNGLDAATSMRSGSLTLSSCRVSDNVSDLHGGGIHFQDGDLSMTSCEIDHNSTTTGRGGGINFEGGPVPGGKLTMMSANVHDNLSRDDPAAVIGHGGEGGGLFLQAGAVSEIHATVFANNQSHYNGGGITAWSPVTIDQNSTFTGNKAGRNGGGLYDDIDPSVWPANPTNTTALTSTPMSSNKADAAITDLSGTPLSPPTNNGIGDGGAVFHDRGNLTVQNSTIGGASAAVGNTAVNGGGIATYVDRGSSGQTGNVTITGMTIRFNSATASGGGLQNGGGSLNQGRTVQFNPTLLLQMNSAANGAGISTTAGSTVITGPGITMSSNSASVSGGGLFISGGTLTFTAFTINVNTATSSGAALAATGGTVTASGIQFLSNNAGAGTGGAIHNGGGSVTVNLSRFFGNAAGTSTGWHHTSGTSNAERNWWACDAFPASGTSGCQTASVAVDADPRLDLRLTASPTQILPSTGTSTLIADATKDSSGATISPTPAVLVNRNVTFASGPLGSINAPLTVALTSTGTITKTFSAGSTAGNATPSATLENGIQPATILIDTPPTITGSAPLTRTVGASATSSQIATVTDPDQALNTMVVTQALNSGSGVTLTNIAVSPGGSATADIAAACTATASGFTLTVTDQFGITDTDPLTVNVSANTPPTLAYSSPHTAPAAQTTNVNPATGPADNGTIASIVVQAGPGFVSVNNSTAVVTATPTGSDVGDHTVTIRATDNCGATTDTTFTLQVKAPPTVTSPTASAITQSSATLGGTISATGNDAISERGVVYSSTDTTPMLGEPGVSSALSPDATATFTANVGGFSTATLYHYAAYAKNSIGTSYSSAANFTTTSVPPSISPAGPLSRQQGSTSASTIATVSDDVTPAGSLTVGATPPAGISVTALTNSAGDVSASVGADCTATLGDNTVPLSVTDGDNQTTNANLTVTVSANPAPTLSYASPHTAPAAQTTNVNAATGPSDNGTIASIVVQAGPGFVSVNTSTGVVTATPTGADVGDHTVTIRPTDNCGLSTDASFTLQVKAPPTVTSPTASAITQSSATLGGTISATGNDAISERGVVYSPTDATPTIGEPGVTKAVSPETTSTFTANVTGLSAATQFFYGAYASNGFGTSYSSVDSFTTTTAISNPPEITPAGPLSRQQGGASASTIATVSDDVTPAGSLGVGATPPAGISVTALTNSAGSVSAGVGADCTATLGDNTVPLSVTDGDNQTTNANLTVTVSVNTAPGLSYASPQSANVGGTTMINPQVGPSDNGSVASIVKQVGPSFVSVDNSTGVVTATPGGGDAGSYQVTIQATDNCGVTTDASFTLDVGQPTSVHLSSFTARFVRRGIELRWRTAQETEVIGFDVFRARGGRLVKVNRRLVAARAAGSSRGAVYRLVDRGARAGVIQSYRLRATTLAGTRVWMGRVRPGPSK